MNGAAHAAISGSRSRDGSKPAMKSRRSSSRSTPAASASRISSRKAGSVVAVMEVQMRQRWGASAAAPGASADAPACGGHADIAPDRPPAAERAAGRPKAGAEVGLAPARRAGGGGGRATGATDRRQVRFDDWVAAELGAAPRRADIAKKRGASCRSAPLAAADARASV